MSVPYYSLSEIPGQTDSCSPPSGWYVNIFTWLWKLKIIWIGFITQNPKNLVNTLIMDSYGIHFIRMCTYIVTVMANRPPHNFNRHRFRPSRIPYHSVAIRFKAVITRAAPENPVIITVILQRISHPIGVPGKSFVWGKNWWTFMVLESTYQPTVRWINWWSAKTSS